MIKKQFYYQLREHFFSLQTENSNSRIFAINGADNSYNKKRLQKYGIKSSSSITPNSFANWYNYQQIKIQLSGGINSWKPTPFSLNLRTQAFSIENRNLFIPAITYSADFFDNVSLDEKINSISGIKRYSQYAERCKLIKRYPQINNNIIDKAIFKSSGFKRGVLFPKTWLRRKLILLLKKQKKKKIFMKKSKTKKFFKKSFKTSEKYYLVPTEAARLYNSKDKLNQLISILSANGISNTRLFFINRFSFSRFLFNWELAPKIKKRAIPIFKSTRFFTKMDRYRAKHFRYRAVFLEDFARIAFFALAMKKSKVLLQFCAYAIANLPRKRKETNFRRFFIKLLKIFSSVRPEITGVRFRVSGRVNRWNRRKQIRGQQGVLAFQTFVQHIDYANVRAVNRKGALGLRLWVVYHYKYQYQYSQAIIAYFAQSSKVTNKKHK